MAGMPTKIPGIPEIPVWWGVAADFSGKGADDKAWPR